MKFIITYLTRFTTFKRNAQMYLLSTVLAGLSFGIFGLLFNLYVLNLGHPTDVLGLVLAIPAFVAVAAALPSGWLGDHLGGRGALIVGTFGSALAMALMLVWTDVTGLMIASLIFGAANTIVAVIMGPFLTENSSESERTYLFSADSMIVTLTAFIGSLIGGALPSALGTLLGARAESPTAYQAALWVAAVLNLLSLVPFLFVTRAPRHTPRVRVVAPWRAIKNWRVVIQLLIPNAAISLGAGLFIPFLNVIWKERFALPDVTIGLLFGVANLTTVTGMLLAPMLSERLGRVRTTVVAQMLSVPFLLLFGLAPWYPLVVSAFLIRAMLMRMAEPVFYAFEMEQVTASERATFSALGSIVGNLTWGLSAWLSGILQVQSGFGLIFPAVAVLYTVGIACEYLFFGRVPEASTPARVELALSAPAE